jgi:hypothetical protein
MGSRADIDTPRTNVRREEGRKLLPLAPLWSANVKSDYLLSGNNSAAVLATRAPKYLAPARSFSVG